VLTSISKTDLDTALQSNALHNAQKAEEAVKEAKTDEAKEQWENARDFWKELAEDGFVR
jgi:hypothetical protein